MSKLLRRPTRTTSCFFCQTEQQPRDTRSFRCSSCACWNRYDRNGEIMSDDPAMHDESLNARSFAKRASPRKDRLPTMYSQGHGLFCHTCQTNQMLISNLLSNYLPSQDDPEYSRLLAQLPTYQTSLETRYPPICVSCMPAVEEEIKRRDNMARTSALGGFLKESKGKGKQRQGSVTQGQKELLERQLMIWRVRGILWAVSVAAVIGTYGAVVAGYTLPRIPPLFISALPLLALLSIMWAAWDPTYASLKRSQLQGREVRQRGKQQYNILQSLAWLSRLITSLLLALPSHKATWDFLHIHSQAQVAEPSESATSWMGSPSLTAQWYFGISLVIEIFIFARSLYVLRIDRPPAVRLMPQHSFRPSHPGSRQQTPSLETAPPDLLSSLSLSNKPILPGHAPNAHALAVANGSARSGTPNPVFGITSFTSAAAHIAPDGNYSVQDAMDQDFDRFDDEFTEHNDDDADMDADQKDRDPNAMDWSPIAPASRDLRRRSLKRMSNGHGPQQQRQQQPGKTGSAGGWDDGTWLRPQKFFVPEEPTGLEGLFEKTITLADDALLRGGDGSHAGQSRWVAWVKNRWRSDS